MKRYMIVYTAASGDWLGYNVAHVTADSEESAIAKWIVERKAHPMRMRYSFSISAAPVWRELDTRK